jgi:hypothetical protein
MQDPASGLPRKSLPRTPVNTGVQKDWGAMTPALHVGLLWCLQLTAEQLVLGESLVV